ncbi:M23 family metallopeptidase [Pseudanabaena sp. PCC 6802]|uniref:M23 family metallopeptidase n=1 Tax=Pseudanabaena sp. PCC 6802 TaxID=118173 RepID=UPI000346A7BD|nr:M23 family metallopeptidase [Pseudanabaena sp. PCC 6802]
MHKLFVPTLTAIALLSCSSASSEVPVQLSQKSNAPDMKFDLPLKCNLGKDCFVLNYTDRDPGSEAVDFGCGRMTYNGHTGTDFAIPDERVMRQGVPVIAAANGKVLRVRDGIVDRKTLDTKDSGIEGKECGNGVVIDHGQGWETQYCHMRHGSVVAKPGTQVKSGTVLGLVGQSGAASFPHVHFEARYQGKPVDPFLGVDAQIERKPGCKVPAKSMWRTPLVYVPTGLMNAGFADRVPKLEDAEQGKFDDITLSANAGAIVFWVRTYGVLKDDLERIRLIAPNGSVIANSEKNIEKPSRTWMLFTGKRNKPEQKLATGTWRGEYQLIRNGKALIDVKREIKIN